MNVCMKTSAIKNYASYTTILQYHQITNGILIGGGKMYTTVLFDSIIHQHKLTLDTPKPPQFSKPSLLQHKCPRLEVISIQKPELQFEQSFRKTETVKQ